MPESPINKEYAKRFAQEVLSKHPGRNTFSGQDLLSITESKQVNLLMLWQLKDAWEVEKANLTSPYFDYESEQVATALKNLLNALSQNIKINREIAAALIADAVTTSLKIIKDPSSWVSGQLERFAKPAIDLGKIRELGKYLTHHKAVLDGIAKEAQATNQKHVLKGDLSRMLYHDSDKLKAASEQLWNELNSILEIPKPEPAKPDKPAEEPTQPQNLFEQIEAAEEENINPPRNAPQPLVFEPEPEPEEPEQAISVAIVEPEPVAIVSEAVEPQPVTVSTASPVLASPAPIMPEPTQEKPATGEQVGAQAAESPEPTQFYQTLQAQGSFYSSIKDKNIKKLSESISMALKFRFISGLFNNDAAAYQTAIDQLDKAASSTEALKLLENDMAAKHGWSTESEVYVELEKVVKRRFQ